VVFAVNPVKLLVKLPVPLPSFVELLAVVGFCDVLQQTLCALLEIEITPNNKQSKNAFVNLKFIVYYFKQI
jgi:hypothetical protein